MFTALENLFALYEADVLDRRLRVHWSSWLLMNLKGNTGVMPLTDKWKSDEQVLILVIFTRWDHGKNFVS